MDFLADLINVNLSLEGFFDLRRGAADSYGPAASSDLFDFHAVGLQASGNLRGICLRDAEALAKVFRSEPLMVVR